MKELLVPRVSAVIDGLPFNSEGYKRVKNILMTKCGKPSEVANAHILCIMGLPVITRTNPTRINEFYEKMVTNIQTLGSMGKEKDIKQLLDEVEHDIMNYQNRGLCYRLRQIIQTRGFDNS